MKIENESDLEKAFIRLGEIWDCKVDDEYFEERCSLVDEIARYQYENVKIEPPRPIDTINFMKDQFRLYLE